MTDKVSIYSNGILVEIDVSELEIRDIVDIKNLRSLLFKTEVYERMTDEELEIFNVAMNNTGTRSRLMWDGCSYIEVENPLFAVLKEQMTKTFGKKRADTILSLEL